MQGLLARWLECSELQEQEGAGGLGPGSRELIHQWGGFDSDNGLISSDRSSGLGGLRLHFPQDLNQLSGSRGNLSSQEVACIWPGSLLACRLMSETKQKRDRDPGLGELKGKESLKRSSPFRCILNACPISLQSLEGRCQPSRLR